MVGACGVVVALPSCAADTAPVPREADPLLGVLASARADAAAATAAIAFSPDRRDALAQVAAERSAHADALALEVGRLASSYAPTGSATAPPVVDGVTTASLRTALTESARAAADLARLLSGHRAGLLGSISAACTVSATATLA